MTTLVVPGVRKIKRCHRSVPKAAMTSNVTVRAIVVTSANEVFPAQTSRRSMGTMSSRRRVPVSRSAANAAAPAASPYRPAHNKASTQSIPSRAGGPIKINISN